MKISLQSENQQKMKSELLDAMEKGIQQDPTNYHKFVETLERYTSMQHLCDKLRSTFGECDNVSFTDQCMVFCCSSNHFSTGIVPTTVHIHW